MLAERKHEPLMMRTWQPQDWLRAWMRNDEWPFPGLFRRLEGEGVYLPKMDVYEKEGQLIAKVDLPGMNKENVRVYLHENDLVIEGKKEATREVKEEGYYRNEREFGTFLRRLPLEFTPDPQLIKATYKDGVLEVQVPITSEPKAMKTPIPVG